MNSYTPGPWTWNGWELVGANGEKVVFTSHQISLGSVTQFPSGPANATLALAAPELLAALRELLHFEKMTGSELGAALYAARAAINKATGAA